MDAASASLTDTVKRIILEPGGATCRFADGPAGTLTNRLVTA